MNHFAVSRQEVHSVQFDRRERADHHCHWKRPTGHVLRMQQRSEFHDGTSCAYAILSAHLYVQDLAKIADLVLLMIDASFGFEMETFEFLNILQVHGFPKVMGVLTHLDHFKQNKTLKNTKKRLKHRFWTEVYAGAKLFYLSGLVNGKVPTCRCCIYAHGCPTSFCPSTTKLKSKT